MARGAVSTSPRCSRIVSRHKYSHYIYKIYIFMKRRIKISNNGNKIIMFDIVIVLGVKIHILPVKIPI